MEAWDTPAKISAAIDRLTSRMPGWSTPVAYGVVLVPEEDLGTARVRFPVVNQPVHELPALVLALLAGRRTETATFELTSSELDAAITLLRPAAAATMYNHPNLQAWQSMSRRWANSPAARAFAVFVSDWEAEISSPYDAALRHQIERGEVSAPVHADVSDQATA